MSENIGLSWNNRRKMLVTSFSDLSPFEVTEFFNKLIRKSCHPIKVMSLNPYFQIIMIPDHISLHHSGRTNISWTFQPTAFFLTSNPIQLLLFFFPSQILTHIPWSFSLNHKNSNDTICGWTNAAIFSSETLQGSGLNVLLRYVVLLRDLLLWYNEQWKNYFRCFSNTNISLRCDVFDSWILV